MKFSKEVSQELTWGNSPEGIEIVATEIVGTSRWSIKKRIVIRKNGKLYAANFSVGATEYQDEQAFQYEDEVEFYEVEIVMVPSYRKKA